jgi:hypothetical protein
MKTLTSCCVVVMLLALGGAHAGAQSDGRVESRVDDNDLRALRERLEAKYDFVALTDGLALRPKARMRDVRLVEITGGAVLVNGVAVTGQELRERLGADASSILKLSYLPATDLRSLATPVVVEPPSRDTPRETAETADPQPPLERAESSTPEQPSNGDEGPRRARRSHGDRIRIFGDIAVEADEEINGQVVAVFGSIRVDGHVRNEVVAVMGSVRLGPEAVVGQEVVSVGGRVLRDPKAQTRGGVTEVALDQTTWPLQVGPWNRWADVPPFMPFGAVPRLFGTALRVTLLLLLTGIALIVARRSVEASAERVTQSPLKATIVGLFAELLALPILILTALVLIISIVGIPLLLLLPFVALGLILMALIGFTGTAAAIGRIAQRRIGPGYEPGYFAVLVGVLLILSPVLIGRLLALAGWPLSPLVFILVGFGFLFELLAWASGFGAMLLNALGRWHARRNGTTALA